MKTLKQYTSPNHTPVEISVGFVVLHYTATSLKRTLDIFMDPARKASAHLVIDRNGDVYEVVPCLESSALRAWHAGVSRLRVSPSPSSSSLIDGFNDRAIGIELVNFNGNVWPYTDAQYTSLFSCLALLKVRYPDLVHLSSVVGHEDIAGFRGKSDPGRQFDWARLEKAVYPGQRSLNREFCCSAALAERLTVLYEKLGIQLDTSTGCFVGPGVDAPEISEAVSSVLEAALTEGA